MYADDICLATQDRCHDVISSALSEDMAVIADYFQKWHLKLSEQKTVVSCFHLDNHQARKELNVVVDNRRLDHQSNPTYLGVTLDRTLTYKEHLCKLKKKVATRVNLVRKVAGTTWGANAKTLRITTLALVYSTAEYCAPVWESSHHTEKLDTQLRSAMRVVSGTLKSTPTSYLPVLCNIPPPHLRRKSCTLRTAWKAKTNPNNILHQYVQDTGASPRLKSRNSFSQRSHSLLENGPPFPITKAQQRTFASSSLMEWWGDEWQLKGGQLAEFRTPEGTPPQAFDLNRKEWCTLNRLLTGHGRSGHMKHKWNWVDSPACDCGAPIQTCSHIVNDCPKRKFLGGMRQLALCDSEAREWLKDMDVDI